GEVDTFRIGQSLNVEAVLTGKISSQNGQLQLEAKLINSTDGSQLWGNSFPLTESNTLNIQNDISETVISKLQSPANNEKSKQLAAKTAENPEAYRYYLIGRYYWKNRDSKNIDKAIEEFNRAIKIDKGYARAY